MMRAAVIALLAFSALAETQVADKYVVSDDSYGGRKHDGYGHDSDDRGYGRKRHDDSDDYSSGYGKKKRSGYGDDSSDDHYGKKDGYKRVDHYGKNDGYGKKDDGYGKKVDGYGKSDGYGKKDDGYGKSDGYGKKDDGYGKKDVGYGKKDDGYGKKDDGYGKKDDGYGKSDGYGKKDDGYGKSDGYGKKDDGYGKKDVGYGKKDDGYGKKDDGYGKKDDGYGKKESYGKTDGYGKKDDGYGKKDGGYYVPTPEPRPTPEPTYYRTPRPHPTPEPTVYVPPATAPPPFVPPSETKYGPAPAPACTSTWKPNSAKYMAYVCSSLYASATKWASHNCAAYYTVTANYDNKSLYQAQLCTYWSQRSVFRVVTSCFIEAHLRNEFIQKYGKNGPGKWFCKYSDFLKQVNDCYASSLDCYPLGKSLNSLEAQVAALNPPSSNMPPFQFTGASIAMCAYYNKDQVYTTTK